jgi:hypothetical protein
VKRKRKNTTTGSRKILDVKGKPKIRINGTITRKLNSMLTAFPSVSVRGKISRGKKTRFINQALRVSDSTHPLIELLKNIQGIRPEMRYIGKYSVFIFSIIPNMRIKTNIVSIGSSHVQK